MGWPGRPLLGSVLVNLFSLAQGDTPSAEEVSDGYWVFFLGAIVIGVVGMVNGLGLLRRYPVARSLLAISSLVLFLPSIGLVVPLLVLVPRLWLTLSRDGKGTLKSYMAREGG